MEKSKYLELFKVFKDNGVDIDSLYDKLLLYAKLLKEWNEKINLTSIVEEDEVFIKHFYDSLIPTLYMNLYNKKLVDIGSGAGFPGAVIALAYPNVEVTLVDATKKKFLFLEEIKEKLGISNLSFYVQRVELIKDKREYFDFCIARGFASTRIQIEVGTPLVRKGGEIVAMKSLKAEEDDTEAKKTMKKMFVSFKEKHKDMLPEVDQVRATYIYKKNKETPRRYPRAWSLITTKSL